MLVTPVVLFGGKAFTAVKLVVPSLDTTKLIVPLKADALSMVKATVAAFDGTFADTKAPAVEHTPLSCTVMF